MSENKIFDRGSAPQIEATITEAIPFDGEDAIDPTSVKITITDPAGSPKVTSQNMTKSATGQYYYVCQTLDTWAVGWYQAKIVTTGPNFNDVTVDEQAFYLK